MGTPLKLPSLTALEAISYLSPPSTRLTGKKYSVQQDWGSEQDKSLSEIKRIMSSEPVLKLADLNEPFVIQCDSSNTGIGRV